MFWLAATLINVSTTQYFLKIITQPPVNRHCRSCAIPNPNTDFKLYKYDNPVGRV